MNRLNILQRWNRVHFLCVVVFVYAFSIFLTIATTKTTTGGGLHVPFTVGGSDDLNISGSSDIHSEDDKYPETPSIAHPTDTIDDDEKEISSFSSSFYDDPQFESTTNVTFVSYSPHGRERVFLDNTKFHNHHVTKIGPLHRPSEASLFRPKQYSIQTKKK